MTRTPDKPSPSLMKTLLFAGMAEAACIIAGVIAWLQTDSISWLVIGIVASLGFSLPAIIQLIRARRG